MRPYQRFVAVQSVPLTALAKFGALGLYDLIQGDGFATIRTFALVLGLVTPFMMAASLRARLLLMSDATTPGDIAPMKRLLWFASLVGFASSSFVLLGTPYLTLGLLMAGTKLVENILGAQVAELQRSGARDRAIMVRLSRNLLGLAAYATLFVTHSLAATLGAELVIGLASVLLLERSLPAAIGERGRGYLALLRDSAGFSLAAFLNAAVAALLLRRLLAGGLVETAEVVGVVASLLNVSGRLLAENNLFYRQRVDDWLSRISSRPSTYLGLGGLAIIVAAMTAVYVRGVALPAMLFLSALTAIIFVLNALSFALRQSLMLKGRLAPVVLLHAAECAVVLVLAVGADPYWGVTVLFGSRLVRSGAFAFLHRVPTLTPVGAPV